MPPSSAATLQVTGQLELVITVNSATKLNNCRISNWIKIISMRTYYACSLWWSWLVVNITWTVPGTWTPEGWQAESALLADW